MLMGRAGGYGFLPSAIGFPEQHSAGSVSLDGTHATALEIYRGSGDVKKSAGIEKKKDLTQ